MAMIDMAQNKLMMSDSLKGMVPELEDENSQIISEVSNGLIIAALEIQAKNEVIPFVGSIDGLQIEEKIIKIDIKLKTHEAYDLVMAAFKKGFVVCNALQLHYVDTEDRIVGPFKITSPKLFGMDLKNKTGILGIDLTRIDQ